jgi:hypothetical protein
MSEANEVNALVSDDVIDAIVDEIALKQELQKLNNEDLIKKAITDYTDWTWHPVVEVMMDRLSPGWEGTDEDDE